MNYATRGGRSATHSGYVLGQPNKDGFRFGPGRFVSSKSLPEENVATVVPAPAGQNVTLAGYELLGADGGFVGWWECILDAIDALKALRGPGKVVRCRDRVLMKQRHPHKGRP